MSIYNIHFCKKAELLKLQQFINKHWREGHVMGCSKELLEFQHDHYGADYYDFAVAENTITGEFDAIYGFIRTWKYDTTETIPNVGWGAIWKVRDDIENPEIGTIAMKLMKYIILNGDIDILASLGISQYFKSIAKSLHFNIGEMNQYYIANETKDHFNIITNPEMPEVSEKLQYVVKLSSSVSQLSLKDNSLNPYKNLTYFINRYEKHPFFNYRFVEVYDDNELKLILAIRKIQVEDSYIYRIIDALGTLSVEKSISVFVQKLLHENDAEYLDCMCAGINDSIFIKLGFTPIDRTKTIIPEHLNPVEHRYIPLEYAYADDEPMVIFKGDGDQDRPNNIKEVCKIK